MNKKLFLIIAVSALLLGYPVTYSQGVPNQTEDDSPTAEAVVSEQPSSILSLTMAASLDEQGQVVEPTFTFSPTTPQITVIVQVGEATSTPLEIVWYRVTDDGEEQLFTQTLVVAAFDRAYAVGQNPGTLTPGSYRVRATLDGQTQETEFDVAGEPQEMETTVNIAEAAAGQPPTAGPSGTMPQVSPAVSEVGGSDLDPGAYLGPGNSGLVDLQGEYVEIYPFFGYYNPPNEIPPAGLPAFRAEYRAFISGGEVGLYTGLFQGTEAEAQTPTVIYPCPGSDLPGTQVKIVASVIMEENGQSSVTQESVITLGDDTLAPRVGVISTPARGTKVMPGDPIVLTVTAAEGRSGGPWQMGVERIQVIGPEGLVDAQDYQEYRGKACDAKSWEQTYEVTYTVPENPSLIIQLCALAEDFAGNAGRSNCGTFYTGDVWEGSMLSQGSNPEVPDNPCTDSFETTLRLIVAKDGTILGEGHAIALSPTSCLSQPDYPIMTAVTFSVLGQAYPDRFEIRLFPDAVTGGLAAGFWANWVGAAGDLDPPTQIISITSPGVAESEFTVIYTGVSKAGNSVNTFRLTCTTCLSEPGG